MDNGRMDTWIPVHMYACMEFRRRNVLELGQFPKTIDMLNELTCMRTRGYMQSL